MYEVSINYNPYTVKTEFLLDGASIGTNSRFYPKQEGYRLQEWIEPTGEYPAWQGLFQELHDYFNDSGAIHISFHGTALDFQDLEYAKEHYGKCFDDIQLTHTNANESMVKNPLEILQTKFQEVQNGPINELNDPKIVSAFEKALSSEFEIVVCAPMSSGKSTLINAILGADILPAVNEATTAVITRVKDNDQMDHFTVTCTDIHGNVIVENEDASAQLIEDLNARANDLKDIDFIDICGNIPAIQSSKINAVFIDTPGANNADNIEHKRVMEKALSDENKCMVLFMFDYTQLDTDDCKAVLEIAANAMQKTASGKASRDRFVFVCNKMDRQNLAKESYEKAIQKITKTLDDKGIHEPNLFPMDARTCKLIRTSRAGLALDDENSDDRIDLDANLKKFNNEHRQLFKFAPISPLQKEKWAQEISSAPQNFNERSEDEKMRIAEINSGVPALEFAIEQYIEKYAVPLKVKTARDVIIGRIKELDMNSKCEERWATHNDELEKAKQEIIECKSKLEHDKKLEEFKEEVNALHADYEPVKKAKVRLQASLDDLSDKYKGKVKKSEVDETLDSYYSDIKRLMNNAQAELNSALKNGVYKQCDELVSRYNAYIKTLKDFGLLNIQGYSLQKIIDFEDFNIDSLRDMAKEQTKTEIVGQKVVGHRTEKDTGFLAFLGRRIDFLNWFGLGRYDVEIKEDVTEDFVYMDKIVEEKLSKMLDESEKAINEAIREAKKYESRLKESTQRKLSDITQQVKRELQELESKMASQDNLKRLAENDKRTKEWLDDFMADINNLLAV